MKYLFYLLLTGLFVSCNTDEPVEEKEIPDPINGVSEYLLEKSVTATVSGSATTNYSYDEEGVVITNDLWILPANLNSLSEPYVQKGLHMKLYCDSKKRVVKEETGGEDTFYEYDSHDRLQRKITVIQQLNRRDTVTYTYFQPGENNHDGNSLRVMTPKYIADTDGKPTRFDGYLYQNYYYSHTIKLKSWVTYPYNYGRIPDAPVARYTYTTLNGSLRQEGFTHTLDDRGLIIKTVHNYLGGVTETEYSYIKK